MNTIVSGALSTMEMNVVGRNHKQGDYTEPAGLSKSNTAHLLWLYQVNVNPSDRQKQVVELVSPVSLILLLTFFYIILLLSVFKRKSASVHVLTSLYPGIENH